MIIVCCGGIFREVPKNELSHWVSKGYEEYTEPVKEVKKKKK